MISTAWVRDWDGSTLVMAQTILGRIEPVLFAPSGMRRFGMVSRPVCPAWKVENLCVLLTGLKVGITPEHGWLHTMELSGREDHASRRNDR